MESCFDINKKEYLEKKLYYEGKEWKLKIINAINSIILNLSKTNYYENNFEFKYLNSFKLFQQSNSIKDIIDFIYKSIDENNYKIEEKENNINLILLSNIDNVSFYLFKKKNNLEDSIQSLVDGIKKEIKNIIKEERNEMMKEIIEIKEIIKTENNKMKKEIDEIKMENEKLKEKIKTYELNNMKIKDIKEENKNYQSNLIPNNENKKEFEKFINNKKEFNNKDEENKETDQGNNNYIICIYDIQESNLYQQIHILNHKFLALSTFMENIDKEEIEKNCDIYINNKKIDFSYTYKFYEIGKYTIKYVFNKALTNICCLFAGCYTLTSIDLSNFNTKFIWNMKGMFSGCCSLKSLNLSNFNTKTVRNMSYMFYHCSSLNSLQLINSNNNNNTITDMGNMFNDCFVINSPIFVTNNVTDMSHMFCDCSSLISLDLSNFNTNNVYNMCSMFFNCSSLTSLNLSNFKCNNNVILASMFSKINKLCKIICNDNKIKKEIKYLK